MLTVNTLRERILLVGYAQPIFDCHRTFKVPSYCSNSRRNCVYTDVCISWWGIWVSAVDTWDYFFVRQKAGNHLSAGADQEPVTFIMQVHVVMRNVQLWNYYVCWYHTSEKILRNVWFSFLGWSRSLHFCCIWTVCVGLFPIKIEYPCLCNQDLMTLTSLNKYCAWCSFGTIFIVI